VCALVKGHDVGLAHGRPKSESIAGRRRPDPAHQPASRFLQLTPHSCFASPLVLLCRRSPPVTLAGIVVRDQAPRYACGYGTTLSFFSLVLSYPGADFDPSSGDRVGAGRRPGSSLCFTSTESIGCLVSLACFLLFVPVRVRP
jgi:hypothetical protein